MYSVIQYQLETRRFVRGMMNASSYLSSEIRLYLKPITVIVKNQDRSLALCLLRNKYTKQSTSHNISSIIRLSRKPPICPLTSTKNFTEMRGPFPILSLASGTRSTKLSCCTVRLSRDKTLLVGREIATKASSRSINVASDFRFRRMGQPKDMIPMDGNTIAM